MDNTWWRVGTETGMWLLQSQLDSKIALNEPFTDEMREAIWAEKHS